MAAEPDVTSLLLATEPGQRWPMLLLAAVNLERRRSGLDFPQDSESLIAFCLQHRETLLETIRLSRTQTNEVGRCSYLLPCLAAASDGRPLSLIEVGTSRGLLLNLDRYAYDYSGTGAGDPRAPLTLTCELCCGSPPLELPPIASRVGADLAPCRDDEWLRACAFADQPERVARLDAALAIAAEHPPGIVEGDATELLPSLIARSPADSQVVVFHTAVLAYLPEGHPELLRELSSSVTYVTAEHASVQGRFHLAIDGVEVGTAHPHGKWLAWGSPPAG